MSITIQSMVSRWSDPSARPLFKGSLISDDGCCCAQGDVLRCAGWSDAKLREITQEHADAEVAKILGISRGHAVLLRIVNDRKDGCPQDVLTNPEKVLGPNARYVLAFFRHIDSLAPDAWSKVPAAWYAARAAELAAAGDAAWYAARAAELAAAGDAAWYAARDAAGDAAWAAARYAARELVGISHLTSPFFLKMFFDDTPAWLASVDKMPGGEE